MAVPESNLWFSAGVDGRTTSRMYIHLLVAPEREDQRINMHLIDEHNIIKLTFKGFFSVRANKVWHALDHCAASVKLHAAHCRFIGEMINIPLRYSSSITAPTRASSDQLLCHVNALIGLRNKRGKYSSVCTESDHDPNKWSIEKVIMKMRADRSCAGNCPQADAVQRRFFW